MLLNDLFDWLQINPRLKTPRWGLVEIKGPVPVLRDDDSAAIASLKGHPGITALLNRFQLQQALLESQLKTNRFKDLDDVHFLQLGLTWLGYVKSELAIATRHDDDKRKPRVATFDEAEQFERIKNAIESVRPTNSVA